MFERRTPARLGAERSMRLLPPLLLGFVLLIPLQHYFTLLKTTPYRGGFWEFLQAFLFSPTHQLTWGNYRWDLPVYGHLWFVFYLWAYTLALCLGLSLLRRQFAWLERAVVKALAGPGLLIWPLAACLALRVALYPGVGFTLRFYDDWYAHAVSFGMLLLGFLVARAEPVWRAMVRLRWPALVLAAAAFVAYSVMALQAQGVSEPIESANPAMHVAYAVEQWTAIVALLGFGRLHLNRDSRALRYLNSGIFTFYIVHQAALLLSLYWLAPHGLHPGVEASLVAGITVAVCFATYEAVRRVGWLRPLFGQRLREKPSSARRGSAPQPVVATQSV
jgi:hypothetical protein